MITVTVQNKVPTQVPCWWVRRDSEDMKVQHQDQQVDDKADTDIGSHRAAPGQNNTGQQQQDKTNKHN